MWAEGIERVSAENGRFCYRNSKHHRWPGRFLCLDDTGAETGVEGGEESWMKEPKVWWVGRGA